MSHPDAHDLDEPRRRLLEELIAFERAEDALARIRHARSIAELATGLERSAIASARAEKASWAKIGAIYGLTKQGAQQRFGDRPSPVDASESESAPGEGAAGGS